MGAHAGRLREGRRSRPARARRDKPGPRVDPSRRRCEILPAVGGPRGSHVFLGRTDIATRADNLGDPLASHSLSPRELKQVVAAEKAGKPFLAFRDPQRGLDLFVLDHDGHATVGRRTETDLSLPWDKEISGLHAELACLGGEWTILDDGLSINGTFVNGRRVSGRHRLRNGDRIRVGRTVLAYVYRHLSPTSDTVSAFETPVRPPLTETQRRVLTALCRPYKDGASFATPASNKEIAAGVSLGIDAVKLHLRTLYGRFELSDLPQNRKRTRLAECAMQLGVVSQRDLD